MPCSATGVRALSCISQDHRPHNVRVGCHGGELRYSPRDRRCGSLMRFAVPSSEPLTHQPRPLEGLPPSWGRCFVRLYLVFHFGTPHALDDQLLSKTSEKSHSSVAT